MNLLDLIVKIGIDDQASGKMQAITAGMIAKGNIIADVAMGAMGSIGNLVGAAVQAGSSAINAYAEYEQLVGGVDTLYKNASGKLQGYADQAFQTANLSANKYMEMATSFAGALVQSASSSASEATEAGTAALESALEEQAKAVQKAHDAEYKGLQRSLSRQVSEYSKALNRELSDLQKANSRRLSEVQKANSKRLSEVQKANADQLKDLQESQAREVKEYERTTDAAIKEMERRRDRALKLIDDETSARTKAIDDQIKALEGQNDSEDAALKQQERQTRISELRKATETEKTYRKREEARAELAEYMAQIEREDRETARKEQIAALKEQRDAIKDQAGDRKDAVREQYSAEVEAYRESRAEMLEAMKEAQSVQVEAMKEAHSAQVEAMKEAQEEQVQAMRDAQEEQVQALRDANEERLSAMREAQQDELDALRQAQADQLDALRESQAEQMALAEQSSAAAGGIANASAESYEKAADLADLAIKDMSDNSNKMGTDIGRIQDAYVGFARGNFMMLDNLSLGYSGTKEEMERLLEDAEAIKAKNGEMADYSVDSFGDIVEAIHVVQEEMGITGTTASESSDTIQGSLAMLGASWENFMLALTNPDADLGAAVDQLLESAMTAAENLLPRVGILVDRVGEFLQEHAPEAIEKFVESAKTFLAEHFGITEEDLGGFMDTVQSVLEGATGVLSFFTDFGGAVNGVKEAVEAFLGPFEEHLGPAIEYISGQWAEFTGKIGEGEEATEDSNTGINRWIEAAGRVLMGILGSIINIIGSVIEIVNNVIDAWNGFKKTIEDVVKGIKEFVDGAGKKFGEFKEAVDEKVQEVIEFFENLPQNIIDALGDLGGTLLDAGGDLIQGLIDGITGAPASIGGALMDVVGGGIDSLKGFLGIASPSKLFRQLGEYTMEGMEQGIEGEARSVVKTMRGVASDVYGAADGGVSASLGAQPFGQRGFVINIQEMNVREDRDIERIAEQLSTLVRRAQPAGMNGGGFAWSA